MAPLTVITGSAPGYWRLRRPVDERRRRQYPGADPVITVRGAIPSFPSPLPSFTFFHPVLLNPYLLVLSVRPGADPSVQAVSPQVT